MAVFHRRDIPPYPVEHYSEYRTLVREDFEECCAYCLLHEILAAGQENFELDHFRPKSLPQFAGLTHDFYNLYYACHPCNGIKGVTWPNPSLEAAGYRFLDLCSESFSAHFEEEADGTWKPLSRAAEYTLERLRLNRKHLVSIRLYLREIAAEKGYQPLDWNIPSRDQIQILLQDVSLWPRRT
ncbi:MAG TPA: HNH endonuclease [Thermoanaerobaculia bacterium]